MNPRVTDNDKDQITVSLDGKELRGWSYASDNERRQKMLQAREYVEGWCDAATQTECCKGLAPSCECRCEQERFKPKIDAAQRAYGVLWRDCTTSINAKAARKELFNALSREDRRAGISWAMGIFGPLSDAEMIAADIRVLQVSERPPAPRPRAAST